MPSNLGNGGDTPHLKADIRVRDREASGFALVATLMMMVLLMILALGLFSMSTIVLRTEGQEKPAQQARANARLALMMALGELQKNMGPDQRVAAEGKVGAKSVSSLANPHWLNVWKTTQKNGSPWILRDSEKGGLTDKRQAGAWNAKDERIACLVSGNGTKIKYQPEQSVDSKESVQLVGKGSLGKSSDPRDQVSVPLVPLVKSDKQEGAYGWWIGDLGTRANVATIDATEADNGDKYHSQMLAQDASWQAIGSRELQNEERSLLADEPQLGLLEKKFSDRHFYDFTVWSAGLPIDTRQGGWRRDLTPYLESDGKIKSLKQNGYELQGLEDLDNLVGPANQKSDTGDDAGQAVRLADVSPKFGLLRSWAKRSQGVPVGNGYQAAFETGQLVNLTTAGSNDKSVDFKKRTITQIMPVLVEGSLYYNLSYYDGTTTAAGKTYGMRLHLYPRVVLWNPYNFAIKVPESAILMQINGSKSIEVTMQGGKKQNYRMFWGVNNSTDKTRNSTGGSSRGSIYFKMDANTIEPGECLVWSPKTNVPYNEGNFALNQLTASEAPSPSRAFYMDRRADNVPLFKIDMGLRPLPGMADNVISQLPIEWREIVPPKPATSDLQAAAYTQADDYLMSWKPLGTGTFTDATFKTYPMGRVISCAYQYGDEDELPVEWTSVDPVPYAKTGVASPAITQLPDRRTRDGFRLRWFQETQSNMIGSGSLAGTAHLEDSAIGNWNMRASWSFRNPFDNVTDLAPNFFGIYTRDLFDGEVDWSGMNPRAAGGKFHGDPFDQPVRGPSKRILFDIPRIGTEIASLGAFQHANFSEFIWHPTYALGNSLADPRVPPEHTEPERTASINKDKGGWNQDSIGFSTDGRSGNDNGATTDADNWAWTARSFLQQAALDQTLIYDLSYELNHTLWDSYFLSTGTAQQKNAFLKDQFKSPLPNGRMRLNRMAGKLSSDDLVDYHQAAPRLLIDGAFNVNSTSIAAWEALLLSNIEKGFGDKVAFPRFINAPGGEWNGKDPKNESAWSGQRVFSRDEIRKLAEQIVVEVQTRGPFISLGDFVNRRLCDDETSKKGALQAAIDRAGLNASFTSEWPLDNTKALPDFAHPDHIRDATRMEQTRKPESTAWGALGFLSQADLLQFIGPALSARSDTFKIRAYGESRDVTGKVVAKAWCEAVVQRSPQYVDRSDDMLKPTKSLNEVNQQFGRRFEVVFFRWLSPEDI